MQVKFIYICVCVLDLKNLKVYIYMYIYELITSIDNTEYPQKEQF